MTGGRTSSLEGMSLRDIVRDAGAGAAAGAIAATFVCPLDVIKTRLQVHGSPESSRSGHKGCELLSCFKGLLTKSISKEILFEYEVVLSLLVYKISSRGRVLEECIAAFRQHLLHYFLIGHDEGKVRKVLKVEPFPDGCGHFFNLSVQNKLLNIDEGIYMPISKGEFAILVSAFNFILPYLLGWNVLANSIKLDDSRSLNNANPRMGVDYEWSR